MLRPTIILSLCCLFLAQVTPAFANLHILPFENFGPFMLKTAEGRQSLDGLARDLKGEIIFQGEEDLGTSEPLGRWSLLDSKLDQVEGTSTAITLQTLLKDKKLKDITVAVIDGGVDIHHKDFVGKIWVNPYEASGNDRDNDGDGFKNDVNGWNFIGDLDGSTLESTREIARLNAKSQAGQNLSEGEKTYFEKLKKDVITHRIECENTVRDYTKHREAYLTLEKYGFAAPTLATLATIPEHPLELQNAKAYVSELLGQKITLNGVNEVLAKKKKELNFAYNPDFDPSLFIHDHPNVLNEKGYGTPDVIGPNPLHGTHVAGIIISQAPNAKIMALRVTPDGDERDKDVANAIRFAVDHGARIINLSFGKAFSPQKNYVDAAVHYAETHEVLIVHAAGNEAKNNDGFDQTYPNQKYANHAGSASNWIEVGASSQSKKIDETTRSSLVAHFSNYGKFSVDLFAPGISIISTSPNDHYASLQGTSMAAPQVAGIAALILGLHPKLKAKALKQIIMDSVQRYDSVATIKPGTWTNVATKNEAVHWQGQETSFSDLSISGGIVNAYQAVSHLLSEGFRPGWPK
jgi:cell wall-associated protease